MKIAILGGGVAGLSCALALCQQGFDVDVFERTKRLTTQGAGVVLWSNATLVLDRLGMLDEIADLSGTPLEMRRISSKGIPLGSLNIDLINRRIGYPSLSVLRQDLMAVLLRKFRHLGGRLHFDHQVQEIIPATGKVGTCVEFSNGQCIFPEIIVGADGRMNSPSRQFVLGYNAPIFQNMINWIGVFESDQPCVAEESILDFWGVGARFGVVPLSPQKAYWAAGIYAEDIGGNQVGRYRQGMMPHFADWPIPIAKLIQETPLQRMTKVHVHDHDPIDTWYRENLILVGDAAHAPLPTSGQGACQAIEDAWHLSSALTQNNGSLPESFEAFQCIRQDKTAAICIGARQFAKSVFHSDSDYCGARDKESRKCDFGKLALAMADGWMTNLPSAD